ncbi:RNA polymerase sigma-70 factor [Anaerophaga thermohalophila]|jgi:RNA polymerase sigma-70 factor (ECF subfamily)|uniref:RNA polymerase sigma-70 factor n=1 Tax=Anaerophaga thermohalophila TaxID=177400 RepID=UPI00030B86BA|nr:RNA polymerase sigma-70 factor [Anaerophaga thermohalophila]
MTLKNNDEAKFRELLDLHFVRLKRFAVSFLKEEELAEEVVMDVFLRLWEKRQKMGNIDNITTYLFVSVRNACYNFLRQYKKRFTDSLNDVEVELARYESTPEDDLISDEMLEKLNKIVEDLPPKCKIVFKLLREEGLSRKETAKVLNISVNTVDNQVAIAVKRIGEALGLDLSIKKNVSGLRSFLLTL